MATVSELIVEIKSDMTKLRQDLNKVQKSTREATGKMDKNLKGLQKSFGGVDRAVSSLKTAAVGLFAVFGVGAVVRTVRQFEDLQATLKAVMGSAEGAGVAFKLITEFTKTTTFQLEEVTGAFITLQNAGIAPTSGALKDIGNIAAARGKDIRQVAQAIFNATTGEMEMLKQLGIVARVDGEKLNVTYKGVTETIDRSANSIVEFIRNLSQAEFPTAIEERAKTLSGAISNLQDNISLFFMEVGDAGFKQALTDLTTFFIDAFAGAKNLAQMLGKVLGGAIRGLTATLRFLGDNIEAITAALVVFASLKTAAFVAVLTTKLITLGKALRLATIGQLAFNKAVRKNPAVLLALGIGLAVSQIEAIQEKLKEVFEKIEQGMGINTEEDQQSLADLDEELKKFIQTAASSEGATKKFRESLLKSKLDAEQLKLEMQGVNKEFLKQLRAAGVTNLTEAVQKSKKLPEFMVSTLPSANEINDKGALTPEEIAQNQENERLMALVALKEQILQTDALKTSIEKRNEALENGKSIVESLQPIQKELRNNMRDLTIAHKSGAISSADFNMAMKEQLVQMKLAQPEVQMFKEGMEQMGQSVSASIADMLTGGKANLESFLNIFKDFVRQMLAKTIELAIINRAINSILGIRNTSAALDEIPLGFAGGGTVQGKRPIMVGERGPEMFIPNTGGRIVPNGALPSGGATTVVNQSLNFTTGIQNTVRAEIFNLLPKIQQSTIQAVADQKRRGGAFAQAMT